MYTEWKSVLKIIISKPSGKRPLECFLKNWVSMRGQSVEERT